MVVIRMLVGFIIGTVGGAMLGIQMESIGFFGSGGGMGAFAVGVGLVSLISGIVLSVAVSGINSD